MATVEREAGFPEGYASLPFKLSWSAVFGGTFVALGVGVLLYVLGAAVGLTAINPFRPSSARTAGIGTGIWYLIAPLIALFVGGLVGARAAGVVDRMGGAIHGAVIWGLATVVYVGLVSLVVGALAGAAFGLGGRLLGTGASAAMAGAQAGSGALSALGVSANDLLGPINQKLRSQNKPEVTAAELQAVVRDVAPAAAREGRIDREMIIGAVTRETSLTRQDATQIADQLEGKLNAAKSQISSYAGQAETGALKTAEAAGKALWIAFAALLLGLVSSVLGALAGVSRGQRERAEYARHFVPIPTEAHT